MRFLVFNSNAERREGLKALLRQIDRQARFGEAQDWPHAERTLRRLEPDLLLIDWEDWMSPTDARALLANHPGLPVAVLVDDISPAHVRALVEKGVLGVIPRTTDPRAIVRALENDAARLSLHPGRRTVARHAHARPQACASADGHALARTDRIAAETAALRRGPFAQTGTGHALRPYGQHEQNDRTRIGHQ